MNARLLRLARSIVAGSIATLTLAIDDVDGHGAGATRASPIDDTSQATPTIPPLNSIFRMITRCLSDGPDRSECRVLPSGMQRGRE